MRTRGSSDKNVGTRISTWNKRFFLIFAENKNLTHKTFPRSTSGFPRGVFASRLESVVCLTAAFHRHLNCKNSFGNNQENWSQSWRIFSDTFWENSTSPAGKYIRPEKKVPFACNVQQKFPINDISSCTNEGVDRILSSTYTIDTTAIFVSHWKICDLTVILGREI